MQHLLQAQTHNKPAFKQVNTNYAAKILKILQICKLFLNFLSNILLFAR